MTPPQVVQLSECCAYIYRVLSKTLDLVDHPARTHTHTHIQLPHIVLYIKSDMASITVDDIIEGVVVRMEPLLSAFVGTICGKDVIEDYLIFELDEKWRISRYMQSNPANRVCYTHGTVMGAVERELLGELCVFLDFFPRKTNGKQWQTVRVKYGVGLVRCLQSRTLHHIDYPNGQFNGFHNMDYNFDTRTIAIDIGFWGDADGVVYYDDCSGPTIRIPLPEGF
jgi:hypothetical protein